MSAYWSPVVHGLRPYAPGEQPRQAMQVKLNTNENPYPPSPKVRAALQAVLADDASALRLYPDPSSHSLCALLARQHGLQVEQVFVGNGSDEVLAHAFCALLKHEDASGRPRPVLMPDVSYSFYPSYCALYGINALCLPLDAHFTLQVDDYIGQTEAGAAVLANPNAPTGRALPRAVLARLLAARPDLMLLVDEAYVDFGAETAVPLIADHPNLLVVRTLSKSHGLAGLRVGYALGQSHLIEALVRVKDSFNSYPLDRLAQAGAEAALADVAYSARTRQAVIAAREVLVPALQALGFEVLPSLANFVLARHPAWAGAALQQALREQGILVRHFSQPQRISQHLRITVGTPEQCQALVQALKTIVN
jgi:histidinol-phosphate aminotransferase